MTNDFTFYRKLSFSPFHAMLSSIEVQYAFENDLPCISAHRTRAKLGYSVVLDTIDSWSKHSDNGTLTPDKNTELCDLFGNALSNLDWYRRHSVAIYVLRFATQPEADTFIEWALSLTKEDFI